MFVARLMGSVTAHMIVPKVKKYPSFDGKLSIFEILDEYDYAIS